MLAIPMAEIPEIDIQVTVVKAMVIVVRVHLEAMKAEDRRLFIKAIMKGYCESCGAKEEENKPCPCLGDWLS